MGQADVYEFLKKNPDKWYTVKQMNKELKIPEPSLIVSARKLKHQDMIASRRTNIKINTQGYACNEYKFLEEPQREFITRCKKFRVKERKPRYNRKTLKWKTKNVKSSFLLEEV